MRVLGKENFSLRWGPSKEAFSKILLKSRWRVDALIGAEVIFIECDSRVCSACNGKKHWKDRYQYIKVCRVLGCCAEKLGLAFIGSIP